MIGMAALHAGQRRSEVGRRVVRRLSSACRYRPASSGARRSKKVSRSARTFGAAFSWMSNPARGVSAEQREEPGSHLPRAAADGEHRASSQQVLAPGVSESKEYR